MKKKKEKKKKRGKRRNATQQNATLYPNITFNSIYKIKEKESLNDYIYNQCLEKIQLESKLDFAFVSFQ